MFVKVKFDVKYGEIVFTVFSLPLSPELEFPLSNYHVPVDLRMLSSAGAVEYSHLQVATQKGSFKTALKNQF
jgi:hypothetical protein